MAGMQYLPPTPHFCVSPQAQLALTAKQSKFGPSWPTWAQVAGGWDQNCIRKILSLMPRVSLTVAVSTQETFPQWRLDSRLGGKEGIQPMCCWTWGKRNIRILRSVRSWRPPPAGRSKLWNFRTKTLAADLKYYIQKQKFFFLSLFHFQGIVGVLGKREKWEWWDGAGWDRRSSPTAPPTSTSYLAGNRYCNPCPMFYHKFIGHRSIVQCLISNVQCSQHHIRWRTGTASNVQCSHKFSEMFSKCHALEAGFQPGSIYGLSVCWKILTLHRLGQKCFRFFFRLQLQKGKRQFF